MSIWTHQSVHNTRMYTHDGIYTNTQIWTDNIIYTLDVYAWQAFINIYTHADISSVNSLKNVKRIFFAFHNICLTNLLKITEYHIYTISNLNEWKCRFSINKVHIKNMYFKKI